jgi:hypothetical protein
MNTHAFVSMEDVSRTRSHLAFRPRQTNASEKTSPEKDEGKPGEEKTCLFFVLAMYGALLLAQGNPNAFAPFVLNAGVSWAFPAYGGPKDRAWVRGGFGLAAVYVVWVVCALRA